MRVLYEEFVDRNENVNINPNNLISDTIGNFIEHTQRVRERHFQTRDYYSEKRNFGPDMFAFAKSNIRNSENESFEGVSHFNFCESGEGPRATKGNYSSSQFIQYTRIKHGTHTSEPKEKDSRIKFARERVFV